MEARAAIARIEALIHQEVGRNAVALFEAARGGLWSAASALAAEPKPRIGLLTGFYVPQGDPPAAETDGPCATALLAYGLTRAGVACRVLTDDLCGDACLAALHGAGLMDVPVDTLAVDAPAGAAIAACQAAGIDWIIAIERCGPSAGGPPRNMRGQDISRYVAPLHELFTTPGFRTIAIGDGGNELGMGAIPRAVIARHVPEGETIACVVPADHLVVSGVSHWGVYALLAALALLRPDWRDALLAALDPALDAAIVAATVRGGPAVDGVTLRREATIDSLVMAVHAAKLAAIHAIAELQNNPPERDR